MNHFYVFYAFWQQIVGRICIRHCYGWSVHNKVQKPQWGISLILQRKIQLLRVSLKPFLSNQSKTKHFSVTCVSARLHYCNWEISDKGELLWQQTDVHEIQTSCTHARVECRGAKLWTLTLKIYFASLLAVGKYVHGWVIFSRSIGAS